MMPKIEDFFMVARRGASTIHTLPMHAGSWEVRGSLVGAGVDCFFERGRVTMDIVPWCGAIFVGVA